MRRTLLHIFTLLSFLTWGQQTRVDVSVGNFEEDPSGTVHFDVILECTKSDTAFIGFSDLVFTADWDQFTNPTVSLTNLGNGKSRSGNTVSPGFVRFGIQNNSSKVIYSMQPQFVETQTDFNDQVMALESGVPTAVVHIEITGYTGIDDPALAWVTSGARNENVSNMYTFDSRVPKFTTEAAELRFDDFPTLGSPRLNLTVFLEGPYNSSTGEMRTTLNSSGLLPLKNPYSAAPWNYTGGDSVIAIPNTDIVDWILVEIRETTSATLAAGSTTVGKRAGFLLKDGTIVDLDGSSYLEFDNVELDPAKKQFVVIYHRNHLAVMSSDSLTYNDSLPPIARWEYDFTTSTSQMYGGSLGAKSVSGVSMMMAGDAEGSQQIQNTDKISFWVPAVGTAGYLGADFDMNGQVQNSDKNLIWVENVGKGSQVP